MVLEKLKSNRSTFTIPGLSTIYVIQKENNGHEEAKGLLKIGQMHFGRQSVAEEQLTKVKKCD